MVITCCSHDPETADILPVVTDGVPNNIRHTATTPRLPFCPMAYQTTATVFNQYTLRIGASVTLGCAAGWILHWCCHGEYYD